MSVCHLSVLCVVRYRSLRQADPSSKGVISSVVCVCVCVCVIAQPERWEGLVAHWGCRAIGAWKHKYRFTWIICVASMYMVGFEPAIPTSEQPQTHALDRAAKGIGPVNAHGSQKQT